MHKITTALIAQTFVNASMEKVWEYWTSPLHIAQWNNMSAEWHTPVAENDLRVGGRLHLRMELKDESAGFDYITFYDEIIQHQTIRHTGIDKRRTEITFEEINNGVHISETFDPDATTPIEEQQSFCQSILDNFKRYAENSL